MIRRECTFVYFAKKVESVGRRIDLVSTASAISRIANHNRAGHLAAHDRENDVAAGMTSDVPVPRVVVGRTILEAIQVYFDLLAVEQIGMYFGGRRSRGRVR